MANIRDITEADIVRQETVLEEAARIIAGPRREDYGPVQDSFAEVGIMWGVLLGIPALRPEQVAQCMCALKLCREIRGHKRDSMVDLAGYAALIDIIHEEQNAATIKGG